MGKLFFICLTFLAVVSAAKDFQSTPKGEQTHPALILLHDQWGLDSFTVHEAERYGDLGYFTVAVDYYGGKVATEPQEASRLKERVVLSSVLCKIENIYSTLSANPKVDKTKIGIMGWGLGAGFALKFSIQKPVVKVVIINYGLPISDVGELGKIKSTLLAIFPENDSRVTPKSLEVFKKDLAAAHVPNEIHVIKGASQGFFDYSRTSSFSPKGSDEGKKIIINFLSRHLALTGYSK